MYVCLKSPPRSATILVWFTSLLCVYVCIKSLPRSFQLNLESYGGPGGEGGAHCHSVFPSPLVLLMSNCPIQSVFLVALEGMLGKSGPCCHSMLLILLALGIVEKKGTTLSQYVADSFSTGNHVEEKGTTLSQYVALSFGTVDSNYPIQALGAMWK